MLTVAQTALTIGQRVEVKARPDGDMRFIDGWQGTVGGFEAGRVVLHCRDKESGAWITKTFYVPADELIAAPIIIAGVL